MPARRGGGWGVGVGCWGGWVVWRWGRGSACAALRCPAAAGGAGTPLQLQLQLRRRGPGRWRRRASRALALPCCLAHLWGKGTGTRACPPPRPLVGGPAQTRRPAPPGRGRGLAWAGRGARHWRTRCWDAGHRRRCQEGAAQRPGSCWALGWWRRWRGSCAARLRRRPTCCSPPSCGATAGSRGGGDDRQLGREGPCAKTAAFHDSCVCVH
jgi:hypothetical protein